MDWNKLAVQLIRALRGARTQQALSRALRYRTNVLFAWESGNDAPSASKFFTLLRHLGFPPQDVLAKFGRGVVPDMSSPDGVASYLKSIAGDASVATLAASLGRSRHVVGRWLSGKTEIPLADFLHFVEVTTLAGLDFVAVLVDPLRLPAAKDRYAAVQAARAAAVELPWSHAIVHMAELPEYRALERHERGWFASRLGISITDEERCLDVLVTMGRLGQSGERYTCQEPLAVALRQDQASTRRLASFWMQEGAQRVLGRRAGQFAFNTFGVSEAGFRLLRELQRRYFAEQRAIIAESSVTEVVAVSTVQLFALTETADERAKRNE